MYAVNNKYLLVHLYVHKCYLDELLFYHVLDKWSLEFHPEKLKNKLRLAQKHKNTSKIKLCHRQNILYLEIHLQAAYTDIQRLMQRYNILTTNATIQWKRLMLVLQSIITCDNGWQLHIDSSSESCVMLTAVGDYYIYTNIIHFPTPTHTQCVDIRYVGNSSEN